ncbi:MAG TPA: DUF3276 family protein [bacterium]|nr:DUF3276 family protein [bacterium]
MSDMEIFSTKFKTERGKTFFFDVKRNENGKFLKLTESIPKGNANFRRAFMTISEEDLPKFIEAVREIQDRIGTQAVEDQVQGSENTVEDPGCTQPCE